MKLNKWILINALIYVVLGMFVSASWYVNKQTLSRSALEIARIKGQSTFTLVQMMRQWNALHGSVYVPVTPESPPNPYLNLPDRDTTDTFGRKLTKINPAYMTRQLSELLKGGEVEANLTSLKPINPINTPDPWEKKALQQFELGETQEIVSLESTQYRYIAPLMVEKTCLKCHDEQGYVEGYVEGDVRGALSFSFPVAEIDALVDRLKYQSGRTHLIAFIVFIFIGTVLFTIVGSLSQRLRHSSAVRDELEEKIQTDALTGALSRSTVMDRFESEFNRSKRYGTLLSVLMLDLDHFKKINDTYGHRAGDEVLRVVTDIIRSQLREVDSVGRYGGEEFIVLLPDTAMQSALVVSERIRQKISEAAITTERYDSVRVTVSIGLAELKEKNSQDTGALIEAADQALYDAKHQGRNCVATSEQLVD